MNHNPIKRPKIVCIANQKGGVGKTTTAVSLASGLAMNNRAALLIDCDPQANATSGLGITQDQPPLLDTISGVRPLSEGVISTRQPGLYLLPASPDLIEAEVLLARRPHPQTVLRDRITDLSKFDYVILDCPPSLGLLTINALAAADSVIIPLQAEYYALEGLSQLVQTIRMVKRKLSPRLFIEGLLLTMYDHRIRLNYQVARDVRNHFGNLVYRATIPRNIRLSESPSHGKPIFFYDPKSKGAIAYMAFVREFLSRQRR